jgi:hypothetical protein
MKLIFFLLFSQLTLSTSAQSDWEIELSTKTPDSRMGVWTKGDYTILVTLDSIASHLRRCQQSMTNAIDYYGDKDSNLVNYFTGSSKRYSHAAMLTEEAKNGFNLQTLIIYDGIEDENQNIGNSRILENYIEQLVEQQKALVLYKGKRIFKLCRISEMNNGGRLESVNDILNHGYEIRTFYDQPENCIFYEYIHLGW